MREYFEKYRNHIVLTCLFVFLMHGAKLGSTAVGVDTEAMISQKGAFYGGWLGIGRQGLVIIKQILHGIAFNPFFAGMMTLVFLAVSVTLFLLIWNRISGGENIGIWVACVFLWIAHPILTEQFYFSLQSMEICVCLFLTALSMCLTCSAVQCGRRSRYVIASALLLVTFSSYQIFVILFIFGAVSVLILQTLEEPERRQGTSDVIRSVCPWLFVFFPAFLCNLLITKLFFSKTEYLSDQIMWGKLDFLDNLRLVRNHMINVLTGYHFLYSSWIYGALCLAGAVLVVLLWKKYGWALVFYYAALMSTPFLMTFLCGSCPVVRSQLVLPAANGFVAYLDFRMLGKLGLPDKKAPVAAYCATAVLCVMGIWLEAQVTKGLYYTDACRYAQDEVLGRAIIDKIEPLIGTDDIPVVFVGRVPFRANNACVAGETIGKSLFDWDTDVEPQYYWSSGRIIGFLHTLGYDCRQSTPGDTPYAAEFAEKMPVWPAEGSVARAGEMVIVKLSEQ